MSPFSSLLGNAFRGMAPLCAPRLLLRRRPFVQSGAVAGRAGTAGQSALRVPFGAWFGGSFTPLLQPSSRWLPGDVLFARFDSGARYDSGVRFDEEEPISIKPKPTHKRMRLQKWFPVRIGNQI